MPEKNRPPKVEAGRLKTSMPEACCWESARSRPGSRRLTSRIVFSVTRRGSRPRARAMLPESGFMSTMSTRRRVCSMSFKPRWRVKSRRSGRLKAALTAMSREDCSPLSGEGRLVSTRRPARMRERCSRMVGVSRRTSSKSLRGSLRNSQVVVRRIVVVRGSPVSRPPSPIVSPGPRKEVTFSTPPARRTALTWPEVIT